MKDQIKELRVKIDGLSQLAKSLKSCKDIIKGISSVSGEPVTFNGWHDKQSKELEKATDSLYLSKAWLGKVLEALEDTSPYVSDGKRKTVEDIEPAVDKHRGIKHLEEKGNWNDDYNHIEKCDWLREEIKQIVESLPETKPSSRYEAIAWTNAYNYLCEARFHLGFELQRIKEKENEKI